MVPHSIERSLAGVGEHAEEIGNADRRDHHREQEHHSEEAPARKTLDDEQRQAEGEHVLDGDVDGHIDDGDDERSRAPSRQESADEQPRERPGDERDEQAADEPDRGAAGAADIADEQKTQSGVDDGEHDRARHGQARGDAEEMGSIDPNQELEVVV